ncbi:hypothetical protein WN55_06488 [Dufourea novaeangliae]|uniref:Uncharacterized protein n=1 Tax=Dufourea novaeangliae TaxID=178035 RepID=A0A154PQ63_DUFNO|nr:hypothetical protein WN55_06488 [Dufourea novaeangliae]
MSAACSKRFEAVFLSTLLKGPKLISSTAAACYMKMSNEFVRMRVKRYRAAKNVDNFEKGGKRL